METPSKIGKYKIDSLIATGGMGAVYKGLHPTLNRNVILKKLTLQGNEQFVERFNREARIMMDFKNDNIVDVYDHFEEGDCYYIVLEYVDGEALDSFIRKERYLPNDLALYIIYEISKALKYAHDKNVVHRDIKPANILISKEGDIKLVDFGIAVSEEEAEHDLTKVGMTLGTPSYMAPEQFENSKNVDKRADIYSVGVMLYEMVTGKKPYPSGLTPECIANIQKGKHTSARKVNPKVNSMVLKYIKKLMHPKLKSRVQDLDVIIRKLGRHFKRAEIELFRHRISNTVQEKEVVPLPVKKSKKFILPLVLAGLAGIGSLLFIRAGYHNEFFRASSYGALRVNLRVNKSYYKEVDEIFIKSKLFSEDGSDLEYIEDSNFDFVIKPDEQSKFNVFHAKKIYLKAGYYRLKFMVDGNLFWTNFQIKPRKVQKENAHTYNGLLLDLKHKEPRALPFNPVVKVIDQITKEDITKDSDIFIKKGKNFVGFESDDKALLTGQIHYFRVNKKGYYSKDFILRISPDQTDLDLDIQMFPKPGYLSITSNQEGIKYRLNGKKEYIQGDLTQAEIKIEKMTLETDKMILSPGEYTILFTYKGNTVEKKFNIKTGSELDVKINYNKENKSISLTGF